MYDEIMSAIVANEWYKEYAKVQQVRRNHESDAEAADAVNEKIYE